MEKVAYYHYGSYWVQTALIALGDLLFSCHISHFYLKWELIKDFKPFQLFHGSNDCISLQKALYPLRSWRSKSQLTKLSLCNRRLPRQIYKDLSIPMAMIKEP